jgi:hypothetical protein
VGEADNSVCNFFTASIFQNYNNWKRRSIEWDIRKYSTSRSRWSRGLRRGCAAARLLGLRVRILPVASIIVSCEWCVLYRYRPLRRADSSSRGALPSVYVLLSVIRCNNSSLHLLWVGRRGQNKKKCYTNYVHVYTARSPPQLTPAHMTSYLQHRINMILDLVGFLKCSHSSTLFLLADRFPRVLPP